jgi:hypothetical protein
VFGIGLASAVLLDALLVRSVLVPELMLIVGDANWKLPRVVARLLPHPGSSAPRRDRPAPRAATCARWPPGPENQLLGTPTAVPPVCTA